MTIPNYRVMLSFDAEQKLLRARTPELPHCFGEGPTRAAAIATLEQEIAAQVHNMQEQGKNPPRAVDEETWDGVLQAQVSKHIHQGLAWQAKADGIDLNALVGELLSAGLEQRRQNARQTRPGNREHTGHGNGNGNGNGNSADSSVDQHRPHHRNRNRSYSPALEDRAQFIQYVREGQHRNNQEGYNRSQRGGRKRPPGGAGGNPRPPHARKQPRDGAPPARETLPPSDPNHSNG